MTTHVKTSAAGKRCVFSPATSTSQGYHDSLLSVSAFSPLHVSNQKKEENSKEGSLHMCHDILAPSHFPARFTPSINTQG